MAWKPFVSYARISYQRQLKHPALHRLQRRYRSLLDNAYPLRASVLVINGVGDRGRPTRETCRNRHEIYEIHEIHERQETRAR
jgi:hypothetical protein